MLSQVHRPVSGAQSLWCSRQVQPCSRRRVPIAASAEPRPSLGTQVAVSLQAAALLWVPAALALQGDSYAELKAQAQATSRAAQQTAQESAPAAADTAQQAAETVADQLPDWLSDQPLLLVGRLLPCASAFCKVAYLSSSPRPCFTRTVLQQSPMTYDNFKPHSCLL